jgi:hypothetical protein
LKIQIDPEVDTFLFDHVVDGSPLLPTVMQLDLVARELLARAAGQGRRQSAGLRLRDIRVGPPLRFSLPGARQLELRCVPAPSARAGHAAIRCELQSPGHDVPHLSGVAEPAAGPASCLPPRCVQAADLGCGPDLVYPPFFHGPAFRVVGAFGPTTRAGLAAVLAPGLPPLRWATGPTVLRPRILELLMQCCGIAELAATGRMMVPAGMEAVHWHPGALTAGHEISAVAVVVPRTGRSDHDRVFDGQVTTPSGTLLLTMTGYRTTDLGHPASLSCADRLTRCLTSHSAPIPRPLDGAAIPGIAVPEGVSP